MLIKVLRLLKQIEDAGQDLIYTYFTYSILHQLIFHDAYTSGLYLKKLKTITEMKNMFSNRQSMDNRDVSFMIIDSSVNQMGNIKLANKKLHNALGYKNGELSNNHHIDAFIPKCIRKWHNDYMQEQVETG